jgi:hypothetical protein
LNFVCDAIDIADHVAIPKAQDFEILASQICVARAIDALTRRGVVLAAIDFDDDAGRVTRQ